MMMRYLRLVAVVLVLTFAGVTLISPNPAAAASAAQINYDVKIALEKLYAKSPSARTLGEQAKGILVFPGIVKGGFIVGGQYGEGALLKGGKTVGYYNTVQASYGYQAGLQKYGYALFFMTDNGLDYLKKSDGWEVGVGPSVVVVEKGAATSLTTTTAKANIYAFFFDQKGLMAGLGVQGSKITRLDK
jgi:lipid-binding SYLF domain-containing protein